MTACEIKETALRTLWHKCRDAQVSFSMHYEEATGSYWFAIDSPAPSECYATKSRSFDAAYADVMAWLDGGLR